MRPEAAGLRSRIVALTTGLLAAVLLAGSLALVGLVTTTQRNALDDDLRRTATQVAALVAQNRLPATLPVSGPRVVQVLGPDGGVVSSSAAADRLTPLLSVDELATARADGALQVPASRVAESGTLRVVALPAGPGSQGMSVVAASGADAIADTRRGLVLGLGVGVPLVLAVCALLAWRAVGAALLPVDGLRAGAERIGAGGEAGARLPVPAAHDEIRALAVTLNGMLDRLDEAAAAQRRFVADAAHELRSPVASLLMQVDVAARLDAADELAADLLPDVQRLRRLTDDLLLLSRAHAGGGGSHRPEPMNPAGLVVLLTQVTDRYADARVPVRLVVAHGEGEVAGGDRGGQAGAPEGAPILARVDRLGFERALANLLDNGVRHARTRVDVRVALPARGSLVVEVSDDGAGIAPPDRDRVFERFTRLDEARHRDAGASGLGLAIVRELIRRDGGDVSLHAGERGGLLARITLPDPAASPTAGQLG